MIEAARGAPLGVQDGQRGDERDQCRPARRIDHDATPQGEARVALEHPDERHHAQQAQRPQQGQCHGCEVEQVPEEPASSGRREDETDEVVHDEGRPDDVHRSLGDHARRALQGGDRLPRVRHEEDQGGGDQRPLGEAFPCAQTIRADIAPGHDWIIGALPRGGCAAAGALRDVPCDPSGEPGGGVPGDAIGRGVVAVADRGRCPIGSSSTPFSPARGLSGSPCWQMLGETARAPNPHSTVEALRDRLVEEAEMVARDVGSARPCSRRHQGPALPRARFVGPLSPAPTSLSC